MTESNSITTRGASPNYPALLDRAFLAARHLDEALIEIESGPRTPRWVECFSQRLGNQLLSVGLDWWTTVPAPVISVSLDHTRSWGSSAQLFLCPEAASEICVLVKQFLPRVINLPTGAVDKDEEISNQERIPNPGHEDLIIATRCCGLRRDLLLEQERTDCLVFHPLQLQGLAWGLVAALRALVEIQEN